MTEDEMNPAICPSALEEDGTLDRSKGEEWGKHRWDDSTDPHTCAECGATREQVPCICECGNEHTKYED